MGNDQRFGNASKPEEQPQKRSPEWATLAFRVHHIRAYYFESSAFRSSLHTSVFQAFCITAALGTLVVEPLETDVLAVGKVPDTFRNLRV